MKAKKLIAIMSCNAPGYSRKRDVQWQTWIHDVPNDIDYRWFVGKGYPFKEKPWDIVELDCPDDYNSLIQKTRAICAWALFNGYDYLWKTDDDAYIFPKRLFHCGLELFDYAGCKIPADGKYPMYAGGGGYWLSKKAMQFVVFSPMLIPDTYEDRFVGTVLDSHGIRLMDNGLSTDMKWIKNGGDDVGSLMKRVPNDCIIAVHTCTEDDMYLIDWDSREIGDGYTRV